MPETKLCHEEDDKARITVVDAPSQLALTDAEVRRVRRSMRFLSRRNPARHLAEAALAGERPEPELVAAALKRLDRLTVTRWIEQELAVWALGMVRLLPSERCETLRGLTRVMGQGVCRRMIMPFVRWFIAASLLIDAAVLGVPFVRLLRHTPHVHHPSHLSGAPMLCALSAEMVAVALPFAYGMYRLRYAAARSIPLLLRDDEIKDFGWQDVTPQVLRESNWWVRKEIPLAVIETLARVGDSRDLADMQWAATHALTPAVRDAAARILPILRERAQHAEDAAHLLRPAMAPDADTLLRSASGPAEADPAVLLRPRDAPVGDA
jgi:hypothetical protein